MKTTHKRFVKKLNEWSAHQILPLPHLELERNLLDFSIEYKEYLKNWEKIVKAFMEALTISNCMKITEKLNEECDRIIFAAEHLIFQADSENIYNMLNELERQYAKGIENMILYLDSMIPIEFEARSHINLKKIVENVEIGIVKALDNLQNDFYKDLQNAMIEISNNAENHIENLLNSHYHAFPEEMVDLINTELNSYNEHIRNFIKNTYGSVPNCLFKGHHNKVKANSLLKYEEIWENQMNRLIYEFKIYINEVLSLFQKNELKLFDRKICNDISREALAGIIIQTSLDSNFCIDQLNNILNYLNLDESAIDELFNLDQQKKIQEYSHHFRLSTNDKGRFLTIISLILVFSNTHDDIFIENSQLTKFHPGNREWLSQIIFHAFSGYRSSDKEYSKSCSYLQLMLIGEQRVARELLRMNKQILDSHFIDLYPEISSLDFSDKKIEKLSKITEMVKIASNFLSEESSVKQWISHAVNAVENFAFKDQNLQINSLALECIKYEPSLHITIVISGWLSEEDNSAESWHHIINRSFQGQVYVLKWDSSSPTKFLIEILKIISGVLITDQLISTLFLLSAAYKLYKLDPFKASQKRAEVAGKALAHIIKSNLFKRANITLIGFSLGVGIIHSCLKELSNENLQYIHNAILMGGAASASSEEWIKCKTAVSGRLINLYSKNDLVLSILYRISRLEKAVGYEKIEVNGIENYDISSFVDSHTRYREVMGSLFEFISYYN
ncbi:unnamed protein product [Blepharisma stoltei]|uniref:DUF726 domain-containing protein n=1 Tax=Blepharisma stoltei TaxID=1481888 RepID=A0AAU9K373_9CILI|nr:unnamed protein product [Blepharisma stoltei]